MQSLLCWLSHGTNGYPKRSPSDFCKNNLNFRWSQQQIIVLYCFWLNWFNNTKSYTVSEMPFVKYFLMSLLWILHQVYEKVDWTVQNNEKVRKCWNHSECCTFVQLFSYFLSWNVQWYMPNEIKKDTIIAMFVLLCYFILCNKQVECLNV